MKNAIRLFGIIALVAVIGITLAACGGDGGNGITGGGGGCDGGNTGKITISNLPAGTLYTNVGVWDYSGVFNNNTIYNSVVTVPGAKTIATTKPLSTTTNVAEVYEWDNSGGGMVYTPFTRTGTFVVVITTIGNPAIDEPYYYGQITFTNGNATVNYNAFTYYVGMP